MKITPKKEVSGYKISGFDNMKVGLQTVTVTYKGIEDTYTATVEVNVTTDLACNRKWNCNRI